MKRYFWTMCVVALFAVGFAASDESEGTGNEEKVSSQQTEQATEKKTEQVSEDPQKSKVEEIRKLGYNDGVNFGRSDGGDALRYYIQMGQTLENGLSHIQNVIARTAYKEDYGDNINDELLDEYCEQFIRGYKSIVIKE